MFPDDARIPLDKTPFEEKMKAAIRSVIKTASGIMDEGTELIPVLHLINSEKKTMQIIGTQFTEDVRSKDTFVEFCKSKAIEDNSDLAIFVCETWMLDPNYIEEFMANRDKYPSVSDHPSALDTVMVQVETPTSCWIGSAKVDNRKMGEMLFTKTDRMEGRFAGIIPKNTSH